MSRNGSGTYSLPSGNPIQEGQVFSATTYNNTFTDIATAITGTVAADGQTVMTGNLRMNGNAVVLDTDKNTSIRADTDDVITFKIGDVDVFTMTAAKATSLNSLSGLTTAADKLPYTTAANTWAVTDLTSFARTLLGDATAADMRNTLGIGLNTGAQIAISEQIASNSADLRFTSGIDSTYSTYIISLIDLVPATDNSDLHMQVSTDGGSTWVSGASDYSWYYVENSSPVLDADDSKIVLGDSIGSDVNEVGAAMKITMLNPSSSTSKQIQFSGGHITTTAAPVVVFGAAYIPGTSPINAIRFYYSSGNVESGQAILYGMAS